MLSRLLLTTAALLALGISACKSTPKLTPLQKDELITKLTAVRTRGAELDAKRRKALEGAATLSPRAELGACPIKVDMPAAEGSERNFTNLGLDPVRRRLDVVPRKELASAGPGPMWRPLEAEIVRRENDVRYGTLKNYGDDPVRELIARVDRLSDPGSWDHDFLLLADELIEPKGGLVDFSPGRLRGRLFVYSYRTGEIACVGDALGTNSSAVKVHINGGVQNELELSLVLRWDLEREAIRSAIPRLYKAGP